METAIGEKLSAQIGFDSNEAAWRVATSRYLNNGGTIERAHEVLNELSGGGRVSDAQKGRPEFANARQPNGDGEASLIVPKGLPDGANPSPPEREGEAGGRLPQGLRSSAKHSRQAKAAALAAANGAAVAILKIDGTELRDFTVGRALSHSRTSRIHSYALGVIGGQLKHLSHTTRIGDVMMDDELKSIVRQAEAYSDA